MAQGGIWNGRQPSLRPPPPIPGSHFPLSGFKVPVKPAPRVTLGKGLSNGCCLCWFWRSSWLSSSAQWAEVELVNKDCSGEGTRLTSQTLHRHRKQQLRRGPPGSASSCAA